MPHILFLDESGDHSLGKIDPQYPLFVLCGVIMDESYHDTVATEALDAFKQNLLGRNDIILHTLDFTRNRNGFEAMVSQDFRRRFFQELEGLIQQLDFKIVACAIKKDQHLQRYGLDAMDPYLMSLGIVVERFVFETGATGGSIVVEGRGETLNNALELAYLDLKIRGTDYVSASKIRRRIHSFSIRDKRENVVGLQLADIAATPIGRRVLGKKTYPADSGQGDFFLTVEKKFRGSLSGAYDGMGLVVLPK